MQSPAPPRGGAPNSRGGTPLGAAAAGSPALPRNAPQGGFGAYGAAPDEGAAPPQGGGLPRTPDGGAAPSPPFFDEGARPDRAPSFDAEGHPLAGVPNIEDLPSPDEIPAAFTDEAEPLARVFDSYVVSCLYSKDWKLREAGLLKIGIDLRGGVHEGKEPRELLQAISTILRRTVPDKIAGVFIASAELMKAVTQRLLERGPLRRPEAQRELDGVMPLVVDRLGDSNSKADKAASGALLDFSRCQCVGAEFVASYLLKPPKKKSVPPRVYASRLALLKAIACEAGVQPNSREGIKLEETMHVAMEWFNNSSAEVRESAVSLVGACYLRADDRKRIEKYLEKLRPAQRDVFVTEFERVSREGIGEAEVSGGGGNPAKRGQRDDEGFPAPRVPPPRGAATPTGAQPRAAGAENKAAEEEEWRRAAQEDAERPDTCDFCGRRDPAFEDGEQLDLHFYHDCPMLTLCWVCEQVVEIAELYEHLRTQCCEEDGEAAKRAEAQAAAQRMSWGQCPLCAADLDHPELAQPRCSCGAAWPRDSALCGHCERRRPDAPEHADWMEHILVSGCPGNKRGK